MAPLTVERIEAPVTAKAYLMCVFAAFAGILFGFDSGYINGVLGMGYFKILFGEPTVVSDANPDGFGIGAPMTSLIVSILSAGTFFGALISGALADWFGRRTTIIAGCAIFSIGVVLQVASTAVPLLVVGRFIAGLGVGFVSAINILYMSEVAPRKVRGAIVSGYQFAITIGLMLAAVTTNATRTRADTGSYRIPIAIQWVFAIVLSVGLFLLPESPRYYVKKQRMDDAIKALARVRGQPADSDYIQDELAEIQANYEYEMQVGEVSWLGCFKGGLGKRNSNVRKVIVGIFLQMFQQWTGVNFIFYYSTPFFQLLGFDDPFLISMITTIVNVCSTPISFYTIEKFGRRPLLIFGAIGMCTCEFIVAIVGATNSDGNNGNLAAQRAMVAFVCIYIFFFASTWGPGAWVVIGEIFPLPIRAKGVAMSTASNWFWNCIIGVITPYLMSEDYANMRTKVFFLWGTTCATCAIFAFFMVHETKGLSLEQVDKMMDEVTASKSANWKPMTTYAAEMGLKDSTQVTELAETSRKIEV